MISWTSIGKIIWCQISWHTVFFPESPKTTQIVFWAIYYNKKLTHIMGNGGKPNKEKIKKNNRNAAHKGTTTHHLQADSQNQHVIVVFAPSYDAILWML
jgi:hypothetical protein